MTNQLINHSEIIKADLSSIRIYLCGGSAVPNNMHKTMQNLLPNGIFFNIYGSTEMGGVIAFNGSQLKIGSAGILRDNIKAKVVLIFEQLFIKKRNKKEKEIFHLKGSR